MFGCLGLGSAVEESKSKSLRFSSFLFGVPLTKIPKKEWKKTTWTFPPNPRETEKRHATTFQLSRFETYGKPYPIFPPGRPQPKAPGVRFKRRASWPRGLETCSLRCFKLDAKNNLKAFFWGMTREIALDESKLLSHKFSRDRIPEI